VNLATQDARTPLMAACWEGRPDVVRLCLERGADIHARDDDDYSPLGVAYEGAHEEIVAWLEHILGGVGRAIFLSRGTSW